MRELNDREKEVFKRIVEHENDALDSVKQAIFSYIEMLKAHIECYPLSTLDEPEALKSETSYIITLPQSHVCETYLDKIELLVKALYTLQPLV